MVDGFSGALPARDAVDCADAIEFQQRFPHRLHHARQAHLRWLLALVAPERLLEICEVHVSRSLTAASLASISSCISLSLPPLSGCTVFAIVRNAWRIAP